MLEFLSEQSVYFKFDFEVILVLCFGLNDAILIVSIYSLKVSAMLHSYNLSSRHKVRILARHRRVIISKRLTLEKMAITWFQGKIFAFKRSAFLQH